MLSPAAAHWRLSRIFPAARLPERAFRLSSIPGGATDSDVGKRAFARRADIGEPAMHTCGGGRGSRGVAAKSPLIRVASVRYGDEVWKPVAARTRQAAGMVFETDPHAGAVRARPAAGRFDRQFTGKIGGLCRFRNESGAKQHQSGDDDRCSTKSTQVQSPHSRIPKVRPSTHPFPLDAQV